MTILNARKDAQAHTAAKVTIPQTHIGLCTCQDGGLEPKLPLQHDRKRTMVVVLPEGVGCKMQECVSPLCVHKLRQKSTHAQTYKAYLKELEYMCIQHSE